MEQNIPTTPKVEQPSDGVELTQILQAEVIDTDPEALEDLETTEQKSTFGDLALSAAKRAKELLIDTLKSGKTEVIKVAAVGTIAALALAGCAPQSHADATSSPKPKATHSVVESPSPTPSPESANFTGKVNYDRFNTNWESASPAEKQATCQEFFDNNPPATDVVPTAESTGPEVIAWFKAMMDVVMSLAKDGSNPQNEAVAQKLAACLSVSHDATNDGETWLVSQVTGAAQASFDVDYSGIATVTEYGMFDAEDYQNTSWRDMAIAGTFNDLNNTPAFQAYEYSPSSNPTRSTISYRMAFDAPISDLPDFSSDPEKYFGPNKPITVNQ